LNYLWLGDTCSDVEVVAAAFFSTYEAMKHSLPLHGQLAPVNHMVSASVAEMASTLFAKPISTNEPFPLRLLV